MTLNHYEDDIPFTTEGFLVIHVMQQNLLRMGIPNSRHLWKDLIGNLHKKNHLTAYINGKHLSLVDGNINSNLDIPSKYYLQVVKTKSTTKQHSKKQNKALGNTCCLFRFKTKFMLANLKLVLRNMVNNELRVTSYKLRVASYELLATSWKLKSTS